MPNDFERDLTDLLHSVTPDPPDHLTRPTVQSLVDQHSDQYSDTELLEPSQPPTHLPRRAPRWRTLAAAAVIAVLAVAGAVTATTIASRPGTHGSPVAGPVTSASPMPTASAGDPPRCVADQVILEQVTGGPDHASFVRSGTIGTVRFKVRNRYAEPCSLQLRSVAISSETTGGTPFPKIPDEVLLPAKGEVEFTARLQVDGTCRKTAKGWNIVIRTGSSEYSWTLAVHHCTLTPQRVTHQQHTK